MPDSSREPQAGGKQEYFPFKEVVWYVGLAVLLVVMLWRASNLHDHESAKRMVEAYRTMNFDDGAIRQMMGEDLWNLGTTEPAGSLWSEYPVLSVLIVAIGLCGVLAGLWVLWRHRAWCYERLSRRTLAAALALVIGIGAGVVVPNMFLGVGGEFRQPRGNPKEQLVELVIEQEVSEEHIESMIRSNWKGMSPDLKPGLSPELEDELVDELVKRVLAARPRIKAHARKVYMETYTEEQLRVLCGINAKHPWLWTKALETGEKLQPFMAALHEEILQEIAKGP